MISSYLNIEHHMVAAVNITSLENIVGFIAHHIIKNLFAGKLSRSTGICTVINFIL